MKDKSIYTLTVHVPERNAQYQKHALYENFDFKSESHLYHAIGILVMDGSCDRKEPGQRHSYFNANHIKDNHPQIIESFYAKSVTYEQMQRVYNASRSKYQMTTITKDQLSILIEEIKDTQKITLPLEDLIENYYKCKSCYQLLPTPLY